MPVWGLSLARPFNPRPKTNSAPSLKFTMCIQAIASVGAEFGQAFQPAAQDDLCPVGEPLNDMMSVFSMGIFINSTGKDPHDDDKSVPGLSQQVGWGSELILPSWNRIWFQEGKMEK